jgi:hypothetical protein
MTAPDRHRRGGAASERGGASVVCGSFNLVVEGRVTAARRAPTLVGAPLRLIGRAGVGVDCGTRRPRPSGRIPRC